MEPNSRSSRDRGFESRPLQRGVYANLTLGPGAHFPRIGAWEGIEAFLWLAIPYVLLATITGYATRLYGFAWRQAITMDYIPRWRTVTAEIEGASQRIQEDTARFARIVESLRIAHRPGL